MNTYLVRFGLGVAGALLILCGQAARADSVGPTLVGGEITADTTWTLADSPYVVTSDILVIADVTLTIEPGVEIRFDDGMTLQVDGKLVARGTAAQPIVFMSHETPPGRGAWQRIYFTDSSPDAVVDSNGDYLDGSILQYCTILYGGGGDGVGGAVQIQDTAPAIDHCTISLSSTAGIYASNPSNLIISHNVVRGNIEGIHVDDGPSLGAASISRNFVLQNSTAGIDVGAHAFTVTSNIVQGNGGNSILIAGSDSGDIADRTIAANTILDNGDAGLAIDALPGGTIASNTIQNEDVYISRAAWTFNGNNYLAVSDDHRFRYLGELGTTLSAPDNWWGTSSTAEIQKRIYDTHDDSDVGVVEYTPFMTAPITGAPISAPQGITVEQTEGGSFLVSWTSNPESDIAGYRVYYGYKSRTLWFDHPEVLNPYNHFVDVGNTTSYVVSGMEDFNTYISVTAYDADADGNSDFVDGNESWFSEEATHHVDADPLTVTLGSDSYATWEAGSQITIPIVLSHYFYDPIAVEYTTFGGTATPDEDYVASSDTLTFTPGTTTQFIEISVLSDDQYEEAEDFMVALSRPTFGELGEPALAIVTIEDGTAPPVVQFSADTYNVDERFESVTLSVTLSKDSPTPATVNFATVGGSAVPEADFASTSGTLVFAPHQRSESIVVPIIDDGNFEEDKSFIVNLFGPDSAVLGIPNNVAVSIQDDDPPPVPVAAPGDPSIPVPLAIDVPAGLVEMELEGVQTGGNVTLTLPMNLQAPPDNYTVLATHFKVDAPDIGFNQVTVSFPYRQSELTASGASEPSLRLLQYKNGVWVDVTSALNVDTDHITGLTDSLSLFVLGERQVTDCMVTINGGASYTKQLNAQLFLNTGNAAQVLLSNDAGFVGAQWQPYASALDWTLIDPGKQIATLQIHMRLRDGAQSPLCSGLTIGDDIIYDPLAPTVYVTSDNVPASNELQPLAAPVPIIVTGADQAGGSGVAEMQISTRRDFLGAKWQPYRANTQANVNGSQTVYVRVRDGAGNVSAPFSIQLTAGYKLLMPFVQR